MGGDSRAEIVIHGEIRAIDYLYELYRHRELIYFFAWRDIMIRYKQAFFGVSWALVRPLLNMLVFAFVFGKVAHFPSDEVSYPLFVLVGMLPWQCYAGALTDTCNGLINQAQLISKVYFPRIVIPIALVLLNFFDFVITALMVLSICFCMGFLSWMAFLTVPLAILLLLTLSVGIGIWLSALTVQFRDLRLIVPFFVQFGLLIAPVGYGSFLIPDKWQWLYCLNPIVGVIDLFRWAILGSTHAFTVYSIAVSCVISGGLLVSGFLFFRTKEAIFADQV